MVHQSHPHQEGSLVMVGRCLLKIQQEVLKQGYTTPGESDRTEIKVGVKYLHI